jgi:hypothetical protein
MSVVWNNITLAEYNKARKHKRKSANICYNQFIQPNSSRNYKSMLNYLHFKTLYCRQQNLDPLLKFSRTKLTIVVMDNVGLLVPTKEIRDFLAFKLSHVTQELALQQGVSWLQTTSANIWTFSINIFIEDTFSFA